MPDAERDFLVEYLSSRDAACPGCSYSLRGLKGAVCPECGYVLALRVGPAEPTVSLRWVGGLVGICLSSGPVFFNVLWILVFSIRRGALVSPGVRPGWLVFIGIAAALSLAVLVAWIRKRHAICRMPIVTQSWLAIIATTLGLVFPVSQLVEFFFW